MHVSPQLSGLGIGPGDWADVLRQKCGHLSGPSWLWCYLSENSTPTLLAPPPVGLIPLTPQGTPIAYTPEEVEAALDKLAADQAEAWREQERIHFAKLAAAGSAAEPDKPARCAWYQTESDTGQCELGGLMFWSGLVAVGIATIMIVKQRQ